MLCFRACVVLTLIQTLRLVAYSVNHSTNDEWHRAIHRLPVDFSVGRWDTANIPSITCQEVKQNKTLEKYTPLTSYSHTVGPHTSTLKDFLMNMIGNPISLIPVPPASMAPPQGPTPFSTSQPTPYSPSSHNSPSSPTPAFSGTARVRQSTRTRLSTTSRHASPMRRSAVPFGTHGYYVTSARDNARADDTVAGAPASAAVDTTMLGGEGVHRGVDVSINNNGSTQTSFGGEGVDEASSNLDDGRAIDGSSHDADGDDVAQLYLIRTPAAITAAFHAAFGHLVTGHVGVGSVVVRAQGRDVCAMLRWGEGVVKKYDVQGRPVEVKQQTEGVGNHRASAVWVGAMPFESRLSARLWHTLGTRLATPYTLHDDNFGTGDDDRGDNAHVYMATSAGAGMGVYPTEVVASQPHRTRTQTQTHTFSSTTARAVHGSRDGVRGAVRSSMFGVRGGVRGGVRVMHVSATHGRLNDHDNGSAGGTGASVSGQGGVRLKLKAMRIRDNVVGTHIHTASCRGSCDNGKKSNGNGSASASGSPPAAANDADDNADDNADNNPDDSVDGDIVLADNSVELVRVLIHEDTPSSIPTLTRAHTHTYTETHTHTGMRGMLGEDTVDGQGVSVGAGMGARHSTMSATPSVSAAETDTSRDRARDTIADARTVLTANRTVDTHNSGKTSDSEKMKKSGQPENSEIVPRFRTQRMEISAPLAGRGGQCVGVCSRWVVASLFQTLRNMSTLRSGKTQGDVHSLGNVRLPRRRVTLSNEESLVNEQSLHDSDETLSSDQTLRSTARMSVGGGVSMSVLAAVVVQADSEEEVARVLLESIREDQGNDNGAAAGVGGRGRAEHIMGDVHRGGMLLDAHADVHPPVHTHVHAQGFRRGNVDEETSAATHKQHAQHMQLGKTVAALARVWVRDAFRKNKHSMRTLAYPPSASMLLSLSSSLRRSVSLAAQQADSLLLSTLAATATDSHTALLDLDIPLHTRNKRARWVIATDADPVAYNAEAHEAQVTPYHALGLDGRGMVVGVADTGLDVNSCYFRDVKVKAPFDTYSNSHRKLARYTRYVDGSDLPAGHGTHVSGTLVGDAQGDGATTSTRAHNGILPAARLSFYDLGDSTGALYVPADVADVYDDGRTAGAVVHSNSWGCGLSEGDAAWYCNVYDDLAHATDVFAHTHEDVTVLFAAGNDGELGEGSLGTPATAKNALVIGAHSQSLHSARELLGASSSLSWFHSLSNIAPFSSQGPTHDNRLKPELVAPGWAVQSARGGSAGAASCAGEVMSGTSMSAPAAAGAAGIVWQWLQWVYISEREGAEEVGDDSVFMMSSNNTNISANTKTIANVSMDASSARSSSDGGNAAGAEVIAGVDGGADSSVNAISDLFAVSTHRDYDSHAHRGTYTHTGTRSGSDVSASFTLSTSVPLSSADSSLSTSTTPVTTHTPLLGDLPATFGSRAISSALIKALLIGGARPITHRAIEGPSDPMPMRKQVLSAITGEGGSVVDGYRRLALGSLYRLSSSGVYRYFYNTTSKAACHPDDPCAQRDARSVVLVLRPTCRSTYALNRTVGFDGSGSSTPEYGQLYRSTYTGSELRTLLLPSLVGSTSFSVSITLTLGSPATSTEACSFYFGALEYDANTPAQAAQVRAADCTDTVAAFPIFSAVSVEAYPLLRLSCPPTPLCSDAYLRGLLATPATTTNAANNSNNLGILLPSSWSVAGSRYFSFSSPVCRAALLSGAVNATLARAYTEYLTIDAPADVPVNASTTAHAGETIDAASIASEVVSASPTAATTTSPSTLASTSTTVSSAAGYILKAPLATITAAACHAPRSIIQVTSVQLTARPEAYYTLRGACGAGVCSADARVYGGEAMFGIAAGGASGVLGGRAVLPEALAAFAPTTTSAMTASSAAAHMEMVYSHAVTTHSLPPTDAQRDKHIVAHATSPPSCPCARSSCPGDTSAITLAANTHLLLPLPPVPNIASGFGAVSLRAAAPLTYRDGAAAVRQGNESGSAINTSSAVPITATAGAATTTTEAEGMGGVSVLSAGKLWLAHGAWRSQCFISSQPTRVSLVWNDWPAWPTGARALVNDLNLHVIRWDGEERGNAAIGGVTGQAGGYGGVDRRNTVEVAAGARGLTCAVVHGVYVAAGKQQYALTVHGEGVRRCRGARVREAFQRAADEAEGVDRNNTDTTDIDDTRAVSAAVASGVGGWYTWDGGSCVGANAPYTVFVRQAGTCVGVYVWSDDANTAREQTEEPTRKFRGLRRSESLWEDDVEQDEKGVGWIPSNASGHTWGRLSGGHGSTNVKVLVDGSTGKSLSAVSGNVLVAGGKVMLELKNENACIGRWRRRSRALDAQGEQAGEVRVVVEEPGGGDTPNEALRGSPCLMCTYVPVAMGVLALAALLL